MLFALIVEDDVWHGRVREWFAAATESCIVPMTVVQETAYLVGIRRAAKAEGAFLRGIAGDEFRLEPLNETDLDRSADLVDAYADVPLGFVDASIVAVAERLDITAVLTTDRRHFGVVRPAHCKRLALLP